MNPDVICFGALNIDKLYKVNLIAKAEEEGVISEFKEAPGGSAANTAVGLARLGVRTGFVGKIADDREGRIHLETFRREGVETTGITISRTGRSGTVMGFVGPCGNRALYLDPGANKSLKFSEVNLEYVAGAKYLHLSSLAGTRPFEAQIKTTEALSQVKITLDPGMIYASKGRTKLSPLLKACFAILPNENECNLLTGKDYKAGAEVLLHQGIRVVAVKLGEKGCYVTDGDEAHLIEPYRVKVVDSTGAGDAFDAGFLYGLLKNKPLRECGLLGNFVASRCLTRMGARDGLPRTKDLPV